MSVNLVHDKALIFMHGCLFAAKEQHNERVNHDVIEHFLAKYIRQDMTIVARSRWQWP